MTFEGADFAVQNMFEELKKRVQAEGVRSFDGYVTLIDELIEEKQKEGYLIDDDNLEFIKNELEQRWEEAFQEIEVGRIQLP